MASSGPYISVGNYLPITGQYDSQVISSITPGSDEFKEFLVYIQQTLSDHAEAINSKSSGMLNPNEQVTGRSVPAPVGTSYNSTSNLRRGTYFVTIPIANLATGVVTFPHNLFDYDTATFTGVDLHGSVTDPVNFRTLSLPYIGSAGYIGIELDGPDLVVTSSFDTSAFTKGYVIAECLKY